MGREWEKGSERRKKKGVRREKVKQNEVKHSRNSYSYLSLSLRQPSRQAGREAGRPV